MGFLDLIFPKKCVGCKKQGSYLCDKCFSYLSFDAKTLCLVCNKPSINSITHPGCKGKYTINGCFSSLSYNKTVQKLIFSFKYKPYLTDLKPILCDLFYEGLIQNEEFNRELQKSNPPAGGWVLVPVPLYSAKLKKRGYNQSEILANELGKRFNLPVQNLLKRVRNTKTQVGLKVEERKKNIKNAFSISSHQLVVSSQIILVDDVVTTGSTLLECANVLKRAGAKQVFGITLARD